MKWLFVCLAVFCIVAPAMAGEDAYIAIVGNDISANPFYFSPKYLQFLYDQTVFGVPIRSGTTNPTATANLRVGGPGCESFYSQTPIIQPELCDLSGTGSGLNEAFPPFTFRGLYNSRTSAHNSGWYEWWIRLPKKPDGEINIVIQCAVVKPDAFAFFGFDSVAVCAAETGEKIGNGVCVRDQTDPGFNPLVIAGLPKITAIAYPGPSAGDDFTAPFKLTAFKNPSSYTLAFDAVTGAMSNNGNVQILDGTAGTRILLKTCMDKTIVVKLPISGQMNFAGQLEADLNAGDIIKVRMDIARQNTVDIYCHAQSARLAGLGEAAF